MRYMMSPILACGLLTLLGTPAIASPKIGKKAPDFALRDPSGSLFRLSDLISSKKNGRRREKVTVILDFFRTDCKPCRKGIPKLKKLHRQFKDRGVKVVLIALLEDEDGEAKLNQFLKKARFPFTVLVDSYGVVAKDYVLKKGKVNIPALFVVDSRRRLRKVVRGLDEKGHKQLLALVEKLVK